ncbi:uncharacterized protein LOC132194715 [Neocloeon triangulifer]|uniref:uncharacterized protein LOC132194715 n=1 Tax=Neocloeon triangulifer TaxID=2078957 RepID=UPI00286F83D4|nr:uncharacterized protein LOC132194715 [Neocloeon triangulifer]
MTERGLSRAEVQLVLRTALKKDAVRVLDFKEEGVGANVGFMGEHNTLTVHYSEQESENSEISFFLKRLPAGERFRTFVLEHGLFAKEKEMYEKLVPLMERSLRRKMPVADCYLVRDDSGYVILQDLQRMGYKLWDKYALLGRRQVEAAVRAVAALHAGSLAAEATSGKLMPRIADHCLKEALIADNTSDNVVSRQWHFSTWKTCCSLLGKMHNLKVDEEKMHVAWEEAACVAAGFSAKYRNVLSHGDLWVNNVLFNDHADGVDAVLVDFQVYRYAPPALDLLTLLHLTTSRDFRAQHQDDLIEFYIRQVDDFLKAAGLDRKTLLPDFAAQTHQSFEEFEIFGAVMAARYIPICLKQGLIDPSQAPSFTSNEKYATKEFAVDQSDALIAAFGRGPIGRVFEERVLDTLNCLVDALKIKLNERRNI